MGEAAHHIKVTKTGFRAAVPLPAAWVERYQLGGVNGEQRLAELRARYKPRYVNEEGQPFDQARDAVKRCDNNERLGAICCHKLRSCDARADFELRHKLYAWVETASAQGGRKAQRRKERCVPYDLRHDYAIRARESTTWSYADVAAVMGHSPEVHRRTYLREISGADEGGGGEKAAGRGAGGLIPQGGLFGTRGGPQRDLWPHHQTL